MSLMLFVPLACGEVDTPAQQSAGVPVAMAPTTPGAQPGTLPIAPEPEVTTPAAESASPEAPVVPVAPVAPITEGQPAAPAMPAGPGVMVDPVAPPESPAQPPESVAPPPELPAQPPEQPAPPELPVTGEPPVAEPAPVEPATPEPAPPEPVAAPTPAPTTWGERFCAAGPFVAAPFDGDPDVRQIADHGKNVEGPIWLAQTQQLLYCTRPGSKSGGLAQYDIMSHSGQGDPEVYMPATHCCGFSLFPGGDLLLAQGRLSGAYQVGRLDMEAKEVATFTELDKGEGPNDIATTTGGVSFTQSYLDSLERVDSEGNVETIGSSRANGITLSPDERTLYITDGSIRAYQLDDAANVVEGPSRFFESGTGGMTVDCAGNVYAADGNSVVIVSPQGEELGRIGGLPRASNVAFGGADQKTLFVTSFSGGVYAVELNIPGLPY